MSDRAYPKRRPRNRISQMPLHLMLIPSILLVFIFCYVPMGGIVIAFQKFVPAKGLFGDQKWVGLRNFQFMFMLPDTKLILRNTVSIASMKIIAGLVVPVCAALMLNEMKSKWVKRSIQTLIYLPNFLSWVIFGGILTDILSPESGIVNQMIKALGGTPVYFLGDKSIFQYTVVLTDIWKGFGFATIVYLAALTSIDPNLYEAAEIDGARRFQQTLHITLPGMRSIIVLMATLSLGNVLNAGFEQIFVMYSPQVYETGDIIDTFIYRMGLIDAQYSLATAVGLMKSAVSIVLIGVSYYLAYRFADYRIF